MGDFLQYFRSGSFVCDNKASFQTVFYMHVKVYGKGYIMTHI